MFDFDGQVVIVTGSGSPKGIGRTIAKTFAKQKAAVVIADMNEAGVQDTVNEIRAEGGEAMSQMKHPYRKWWMTSWTPMAESTCW